LPLRLSQGSSPRSCCDAFSTPRNREDTMKLLIIGASITEIAGRLPRMFFFAACALALSAVPAAAQSAPDGKLVERGRYISIIGGCGDCHTPGYFLGKPDVARQFAGSEVGFEIPGLGVFHGPNLTPDKETGLGGWTDQQIIDAIQKGVPTGACWRRSCRGGRSLH
jgi:mono/diheme cytochrome c family protein